MPRGNVVQVVNCIVDADHAGYHLTRHSQTGVLLFVNSAPVSWRSKKQTYVEASTFESEMVALKAVTEQISSLCYKLYDGFKH